MTAHMSAALMGLPAFDIDFGKSRLNARCKRLSSAMVHMESDDCLTRTHFGTEDPPHWAFALQFDGNVH
jgi:hypothetical protein